MRLLADQIFPHRLLFKYIPKKLGACGQSRSPGVCVVKFHNCYCWGDEEKLAKIHSQRNFKPVIEEALLPLDIVALKL